MNTAHRSAGRPSKFSRETRASICKAIELGVPLRAAALVGNVRYTTLSRWRKQFPEFGIELEIARVKAASRLQRELGTLTA